MGCLSKHRGGVESAIAVLRYLILSFVEVLDRGGLEVSLANDRCDCRDLVLSRCQILNAPVRTLHIRLAISVIPIDVPNITRWHTYLGCVAQQRALPYSRSHCNSNGGFSVDRIGFWRIRESKLTGPQLLLPNAWAPCRGLIGKKERG